MTLTSEKHIALYPAGHETLRRMADVDRYNSWIYDLIEPFLGRRIVEVGCGIGNMTGYFLRAERLLAFDLLRESVEWVQARYGDRPNLVVHEGDLCDPGFIARSGEESFDTVVSINMLEHVKEDKKGLAHMNRLLVEGGYLLLFVPAGSYLYGSLDRALGHYRRYDRRGLAAAVRGAGFTIAKLHYVNALGVAGWYLNSRLLRKTLLPKGQLGLFNRVAPLLQTIESRIKPPFGQSLLCVARKMDRHGARALRAGR
jgi:SAM-dependent methyltransferase